MKTLKKIWIFLLLVCLAALFSTTALADDNNIKSGTCGDNLTWTLNTDTGALTISGTGKMTSSPWRSYTVRSVTIGNGVTSIVDYAFSGCIGLTSVTIGNSVTVIGKSAFNGCTGLTSITIPDSVTSIGSSAFSGCTGLTSITIPDSVTSIGSSAFSGCTELTSAGPIAGGYSYEFGWTARIPNYAFSGCTGLTNITIPNSVTSIGNDAFDGCTNLMSVMIYGEGAINDSTFSAVFDEETSSEIMLIIENGITSIGDGAFSGCTGLASITIPDSVTTIGDSAFFHCTGLTSITIPDSVTSIDMNVFYGCTSLANVTIGNSVTSIGWETFEGCTGLTSVTIGNGVPVIGLDAFYGCTSLTGVYITDLSAWCYISFYHLYSNPLYYAGNLYLNGELVTELVIPDNVTSIGNRAFSGCTGLTSVTIPDSVTSINDRAFLDCTSLTSVTIPDSVTSIGNDAFYGCTSLTSITIPLGNYSSAFSGCSSLSLVTIYGEGEIDQNNLWSRFFSGTGSSGIALVIEDGITSIGDGAFSGCTELTSVTIPDSVTTIGSCAFLDCTGLTSVYITDLSAWCNISFSFAASNPLCYAGNLYLNGELVTELVIPDSVTDIGNLAFCQCTGLTSVSIPDSVTTIGSCAFLDCSSLTSVTIGNSVTSIGSSAFEGCSSLTSVTLPDGLTKLESHVFYGCTSLTSVEIPDSVTSFSTYVFADCTSLTDITIPDGVKTISTAMFSGCTSLSSVTIPVSVTSVSRETFYGCDSLSDVYYGGTYGQWTSISIGAHNSALKHTIKHVTGIGTVGVTLQPGSATLQVGDRLGMSITIALLNETDPTAVWSSDNAAIAAVSDGLVTAVSPGTTTIRARAGDYEGTCVVTVVSKPATAELSWTLEDGVLTVSGSGRMPDYEEDYSPWYESISDITSVVIEDGVTGLGSFAFESCSNLTTVTLPASLITINEGAFRSCSAITDVYYDGSAANWAAIAVESQNSRLTNATIHYSDGTTSADAAETKATVSETLAAISETATETEIKTAVQAIAADELAAELSADTGDTGVTAQLAALEEQAGVTTSVTVADALADSFDSSAVTVTGGALNTTTGDAVLTLSAAESADGSAYNNALAFSLTLTGDGVDSHALTVPVKITLPVPATHDPETLVLLHYANGENPMELETTVYESGTQWYVSFVLTSFSDFVMYDSSEVETSTPGDLNGDGEVNASDLTILARHVGKVEYITDKTALANADVTGDGSVDASDLTRLAQYVGKIISSLD